MSETEAPEGIIGKTLSSFSTQTSRKNGFSDFIISSIDFLSSFLLLTLLELI